MPRRSVVAGGRNDGTAEEDEMQAYVQAIANTRVAGRLALGVVPNLLWNPRIEDSDREITVSVGVNGRLYVSRMWSLFGEWILSGARASSLANEPIRAPRPWLLPVRPRSRRHRAPEAPLRC